MQASTGVCDGWRIVLDPSSPGFNYETLGHIARSNVVRGNHTIYDRGVTQADFNESVFNKKRQQSTSEPTNQHHKQRDDMSRFYT